MEKFKRELLAAKKRGVDVDRFFLAHTEALELMRTKNFGVKVSIVSAAVAPLSVLGLKLFCVVNKIDHAWIPADLAYWCSAISMISLPWRIIKKSFDVTDSWASAYQSPPTILKAFVLPIPWSPSRTTMLSS